MRHVLELVSEAEENASERMENSGLLQGLTLERVKFVGKQIVLQDGCRRFFRKVLKNESPNIDVHVISDCLCSELIRSAFSSGMIL